MKSCILSWSSGKDAAFALFKLQQSEEYQVHSLFSTLDKTKKRVSMHGICEKLLDAQSDSLNIPLQKVFLPDKLSMEDYDAIMHKELSNIKNKGISHFAFGDILLEDLKVYRENQLSKSEMKTVFPLWNKNTKKLALEIIESGFKAVVVAINRKILDDKFIGQKFDNTFLNSLPENVDPCGENGEFHTFVYDGPNFQYPVDFLKGKIVEKQYQTEDENTSWDTSFLFQDLIPK